MNTVNPVTAQPDQIATKREKKVVPEELLAQTHHFSAKLAKEHGVTAAIVLGYLSNRIQATEKKRKDGLGFFKSISELQEREPYLKLSTIADALALLRKKGVLKGANHNKHKYDRTLWYTLGDPQVAKDTECEPVYLKVGDAVNYGVVEAVLMANLRYWIGENRKDDPDYTWHPMSPRTLANHLPFAYRTIARALDNLVALGVVDRQKFPGFNQTFNYRFSKEDFSHGSNPGMHGSQSEMHGPIPEMHGPKPEMHGSIPEIHGSNPDDDTILIDSVGKTPLGRPHWKDSVCENTFITPQAAPSESCACSNTRSPDTKTNEKEVSNAQDLPMSAFGAHSQMAGPEANPGKEGKSVSSVAKIGAPKNFDLARTLMKPPADYVPSGESLGVSLVSEDGSGSGQVKASMPLAPSVVAVPSCSASLGSTPGDVQSLPGKAVVPPSSGAAQGTAQAEDARFAGLVFKKPLIMPSDPTAEQKWAIVDQMRHERERESHAEVKRQNTLKKIAEQAWANYEELTKLYASRLAKQEHEETLSSEMKVRVLKAALRSRNKTGLWDDGTNQHHGCDFIVTKGGLEMASKFFELNPTVTPGDLLEMLDLCSLIDSRERRPDDGYDEVFYERRGTNLSFFLKHLPTINTKLQQLSLPPGVVYLDEADPDPEPEEDLPEPMDGLEELYDAEVRLLKSAKQAPAVKTPEPSTAAVETTTPQERK